MKLRLTLLVLLSTTTVQAITQEEFTNGYRVYKEEFARSSAESKRHADNNKKYLELQSDCNTYWILNDRIEYINNYPEITQADPMYIKEKIELRKVMFSIQAYLELKEYNCKKL